jgi:hypothetical protein
MDLYLRTSRINLAQDMDFWEVLVNMLMNLHIHKEWEISLPAESISDSQEELCSMKLVS